MLTMQLGPRQALVTIKIKFRRPLSLQQLESAIERIKKRIRDQDQDPTMERIFIEPDSSAEATRDKMDAA
jgi:divalent metal cation (Fe/Co/Zn/Cd) transporter